MKTAQVDYPGFEVRADQLAALGYAHNGAPFHQLDESKLSLVAVGSFPNQNESDKEAPCHVLDKVVLFAPLYTDSHHHMGMIFLFPLTNVPL